MAFLDKRGGIGTGICFSFPCWGQRGNRPKRCVFSWGAMTIDVESEFLLSRNVVVIAQAPIFFFLGGGGSFFTYSWSLFAYS